MLETIGEAKAAQDLSELAGKFNIRIAPNSTLASITNHILKVIFPSIIETDHERFKDLSKQIDAFIRHQTPSKGGYVKRVADLRELFPKGREYAEKRAYHVAYCGPSKDEYGEVNGKMRTKRDGRLSNMTEVEMKDIEGVAGRLKSSPNIFDKILLIQLCSGARTIEAVMISDFEVFEGDEEMVKVVGTAKTSTINTIVRKVLFISPAELVDLVRETRSKLEEVYGISELSNSAINCIIASRLGKRVKKLGLEGIKSAHDMRKIYAAIVSDGCSNIHQIKQIKDALGHSYYDGTISYINIRVV